MFVLHNHKKIFTSVKCGFVVFYYLNSTTCTVLVVVVLLAVTIRLSMSITVILIKIYSFSDLL